MKVRASYSSCTTFSTSPHRCPMCGTQVPAKVEHTCGAPADGPASALIALVNPKKTETPT